MPKLKAFILFSLSVCFLLISNHSAFAEDITITTYYPAPFGVYNQLVTRTLGVGDTDGDGDIDGNDAPNPASDPNDVWIAGDVGIGTTTPGAYKLNVNGTLYCAANSYTGASLITSDERLKMNITNLGPVLDKVVRLRGVKFNWKDDSRNKEDGQQIGVVAQELESEFPELVLEDDDGIKYVRYDNFTAVLLEAIKELKSEIRDLKLQRR